MTSTSGAQSSFFVLFTTLLSFEFVYFCVVRNPLRFEIMVTGFGASTFAVEVSDEGIKGDLFHYKETLSPESVLAGESLLSSSEVG